MERNWPIWGWRIGKCFYDIVYGNVARHIASLSIYFYVYILLTECRATNAAEVVLDIRIELSAASGQLGSMAPAKLGPVEGHITYLCSGADAVFPIALLF